MNKQNLKSLIRECVQEISSEMGLTEKKIQDPTKEEMFNFLQQQFGREEGFEGDAEAAMYWFSNFNHGGQSSNLYSVLSTSQFSPGPIARGPQPESTEEMMYQSLESEFGSGESTQNEPAVDEMTGTGAVQGYMSPKAFEPNDNMKEGWLNDVPPEVDDRGIPAHMKAKAGFMGASEKKDDEDPLYVEYHSQRRGENPFMMHGQKFEYVNAKYPNGKIDVGVYAFSGDMVYGYEAFRKMQNIKEEEQPEPYDDKTDTFAPGPRQRPEDWQQGGASERKPVPSTVNKAEVQKALAAIGKMKNHEWRPLLDRARKNYQLFPDDGNDPKKLNLAMALQYMDEHPKQLPINEAVPKRILKLKDLLKKR